MSVELDDGYGGTLARKAKEGLAREGKQSELASPSGSASMLFPGVLADGSTAPSNSDAARLDYISRRPGMLKNLKGGVRAANVDTIWQPSVRAAIDAAMETERREIRANGGNPIW